MVWKLRGGEKLMMSKQAAANDPVREVLKSQGDDGITVRHVVHYAYPSDGSTDLRNRPAMIAELQSQGFRVRDAAAESGFVFEHDSSVAGNEFDKLTGTLEAWFEERDWRYDGWECAVVKKTH
jgi:hypothetical protein